MDQSRHATVSQQEQWKVQDQVFRTYNFFSELPTSAQTLMLELQRDKHLDYLIHGLEQLGPSFSVLDSSRPWLCYWILHSIALLDCAIDHELQISTIDFLNRCQDVHGGYGGGPGQMPHLATTYAAVNALITLGGDTAFSSINRHKLYQFLLQMKDSSGGFRMHDNGEIDVRACYTAISVASILNILDEQLVENVADYIISCQTYEGGIASEPGSEAHGGYTFCGLATMIILNRPYSLDLNTLLDWAVFRQGVECGFQGRTNKLVDGCYSFWQGGVLALVQGLLSRSATSLRSSSSDGTSEKESLHDTPIDVHESSTVPESGGERSESGGITDHPNPNSKVDPLFHSIALQQYLLLCSQVQDGGFRDKPGKARDYYHTCYCLSGLSLCQYNSSNGESSQPLSTAVLGSDGNLLVPVQPLYNVTLKRYYEAREYFWKLSI